MKLLTKAIKKIPKLHATEGVALKDKVAVCKFFDPCGGYTFYIIEGEQEGDDFTLWGYVTGLHYPEFGYASLNEISSIRGAFGLGIERDLWWEPTKLSEISGINLEDL
jgi:hypothetical protein